MGGVILAILVVLAAVGPAFVGDPLKMDVPGRFQPPSATRIMGTDEFGRDISSRVIHGARISLGAGIGVIAVGLSLGIPLGMIAAYRGGALGVALMGFVDLLLALPGILLAIVIAAILAPRLSTAILAVGIINVPYYARLAWGVTQAVRVREYVEAARAAGATDLRIIARHIFPGVLPPVIVQATLGVGTGILFVTALSFIGLGAQPPTPEWGLMMSQAQRYIVNAPYIGIFPGMGILLAVLSFNLLGDGLRDMLDPVLSRIRVGIPKV
jgi:peptide/nickel transport system permease protein